MKKKIQSTTLIESLSALYGTISSFDNKASSLLTATGVIFAFSTFSIDNLLKTSGYTILNVFMYIFGGLYIALFVATIIVLSSIIFPRTRKKSEIDGLIFNRYYLDIYLNKNNEEFLKAEPSEDVLISQIKINSRIAHNKHILLKVGTITITAMSVALMFFVVFSILVALNPAT